MPTKNPAGFSINKVLEDPNVLNMMSTLGIALDPEGPGGYIGRAAQGMVSSRQAGRATSKALADTRLDATLTPPGQPGTTSIERNKDGSTTITGDYTNSPITPTAQPATPRAQQVPDDSILGVDNIPTMSPLTRRKVIARAKQRGISPITAMNLVTYDLANANEPHLSRYDPDTAIDYFAELMTQAGGDENKALIAYRNRPGSPGDPDYLGNVTAYTPYSMRAIENEPQAAQGDVSNMIASREGPLPPQIDVRDDVATMTKPYPSQIRDSQIRDTSSNVARTAEPWTPRQPGADPYVFNDVPRTHRVSASRGLTAEDFAGLTPSEINQIGNLYMRGREVEAETLLGTRRLEHDVAKLTSETGRAFSKSKVDAAKAISGSGLSKADRQSLLDVLKAASTPQEIEMIEIATANAPSFASPGVERDAVADELYNTRYYDLSQAQQAIVNKTVDERGGITAEVVQTEDGVYVVNKRTNRAMPVTVAPLANTRLADTRPEGEAPSSQTVAPPSTRSTPGGITPGNTSPATPGPKTSTVPPPAGSSPTSASIDTFVNSVSGDPGLPEPGQPLRGKALNEAQARAYGYGSRALQAEIISEELEDDPKNRARIGTFDSYFKDKLAGLSGNTAVGHAGGAVAMSSALINSTIDDMARRDIQSLVRRFGQSTANRLLTLSSFTKTASKAALGAVIANIVASTAAEPVAQYLRTPEEQQYAQAKMDFTAALLRKESGAAILASEYLDTDKRYYPQVNDKEPVIAQKRAARQQVIRLLQRESGRPLLPPIRGLVAPAPPATTTTGESRPFILEEVIKRLVEDMQIPFRRQRSDTQGQQPDPGATLNQLFEPHKGQDIAAGKADYLLKEMMDMRVEELNSIMDRAGISKAKQPAIRARIKKLQEQQKTTP